MKPLKPVKAWAVVDAEGIVTDGMRRLVIHKKKTWATDWRQVDERVVRVEIREVRRKERAT